MITFEFVRQGLANCTFTEKWSILRIIDYVAMATSYLCHYRRDDHTQTMGICVTIQ